MFNDAEREVEMIAQLKRIFKRKINRLNRENASRQNALPEAKSKSKGGGAATKPPKK